MVLMVLIMFLPVIAIPVFWLLPLAEAIPIYLVCLLVSGATFWFMRASMRLPVRTGIESLKGRETNVIAHLDSDGVIHFQVRADGEVWSVASRDPLKDGDRVVIAGIEGNTVIVNHAPSDAAE